MKTNSVRRIEKIENATSCMCGLGYRWQYYRVWLEDHHLRSAHKKRAHPGKVGELKPPRYRKKDVVS